MTEAKAEYLPLTWEPCRVRLGDLMEWEQNPATIGKAEAARLLESLDQFGQVQALAIDPDNVIVDGHQRKAVWSMSQKYGMDFVADCRRASRMLTEQERRKLAVYLRSGAVGHYDLDALSNWGNYEELISWGMDKSLANSWQAGARWIDDMIDSTKPEQDAEPQVDRAAELLEKWGVRTGDLFRVGAHRLLCGDSTSREDVERVMGGEKIELSIIDPPYGIEYESGTIETKKIEGDSKNISTFLAFLRDSDYPFYIFCEFRSYPSVFSFCETIKRDISDVIIWDKTEGLERAQVPPMALLRWIRSNEFIAYHGKMRENFGYSPDVLHYARIYGKNVKDNQDEFIKNSPQKITTIHPTIKPLELIEKCIGAHEAVIVFDGYVGVGSSVVACQNLSRKCRGIEISPAYCAVTLQRMQDAFPGIEIERI